MSKLISRRYIPGDEVGVVNLYNSITNRVRTCDQHLWEWIQNPNGQGEILILTDSKSNEICGHHGLIPLSFNLGAKEFSAGKTENTILHNKFMGSGIYFIHERRFLNEVKGKFDFIFTTSGHGTPGKIRRKLGYKSAGKYITYIHFSNPRGFQKLINYYLSGRTYKSKLVKLTIGIILKVSMLIFSLFFLKSKPTQKELTFQRSIFNEKFAEEIDEFSKKNKGNFGLSLNRSSHYLKWRIFDNPNINYQFISAYRKGVLVGYVIMRKGSSKFPEGIIVDIVAEDNNSKISKNLLAEAIRVFSDQGISFVTFKTIKSRNHLNNLFLKMKFINASKLYSLLRRTSTESEFLVYNSSDKIKDEVLYEPSSWYYTELFNEGFL